MKFENLILFSCLIVFSCDIKRTDASKFEVVVQTVGYAIDSMTFGALDSVILIHKEKYPDKIKRMSIEAFLSTDPKINVNDRQLIEALLISVNDSVTVRTANIHSKHNLISEDIAYFDDPRYFGTISLSNPVMNENETLACYYLALNCFKINESGCSVGYLIIGEKFNGGWRVKRSFSLWIGSNFYKP